MLKNINICEKYTQKSVQLTLGTYNLTMHEDNFTGIMMAVSPLDLSKLVEYPIEVEFYIAIWSIRQKGTYIKDI